MGATGGHRVLGIFGSRLAAAGGDGIVLRSPMADRAQHLAHILVSRMLALEPATRAAVRAPEPDRAPRIALVEKIMAVELGVTDGATVAAVESAMPRAIGRERVPDRELVAFADFLRQRLARQLEEP